MGECCDREEIDSRLHGFELISVVFAQVISLKEKQDDFLRYRVRMVFDKPDVFGFVVKQLNLYEHPSFLIEVYQQVLLVELVAFLIHEQLIMVAHDILLRLVDIHWLETHVWRILLAA